MEDMDYNVVSVSGGKDSTAVLLLALERNAPNLKAVFADTGNEHPITYDYLEYLDKKVHPITIVKADFTEDLNRRSDYIQNHWLEEGKSQYEIDKAVEALKPTGNPFLDLCLYKGRFPSPRAAFCTKMLKKEVIDQQVFSPLLTEGYDVNSWVGVRADESPRRAALKVSEFAKDLKGSKLWIYRPVLKWTAQDCFNLHKKHGIEPNPLYKMGMSRVGCMPCMQCRKTELLEISKRFPEEFERIKNWEERVSNASKRGSATFFPAKADELGKYPKIDTVISNLKYKQSYEFQEELFEPMCSSVYGLCE
ncbi:phosphoadenosine phosphosulfate reductase domain-containing protein [Snodgrassella alvi]|nr:phosphoadenosine phosphosulfate reductase family protein [Snodgrassella alvi]